LAEDKDTALQEHLGQEPLGSSSVQLSSREIALTNPCSETIVSISGKLDKVFDFTNTNNLTEFVGLLTEFTVSKKLINQAKRLKITPPQLVKNTDNLIQTVLEDNWRLHPSLYDVPANSQIFGHLVFSAGIEGILYPSKFTQKACLAIFPQNFVGTDSCLFLDDELPHPDVPRKLDASNWRISELSPSEIFSFKT
jgi:hypothetical protein